MEKVSKSTGHLHPLSVESLTSPAKTLKSPLMMMNPVTLLGTPMMPMMSGEMSSPDSANGSSRPATPEDTHSISPLSVDSGHSGSPPDLNSSGEDHKTVLHLSETPKSRSEGGPESHLGGTEKPPQSYIALISMAILSNPERKMVLSDIYQYIMDHFSFYNNEDRAWRNSVRHNLSLNECFIKAGRAENGKGNYWAIHPACVEDFSKGDFRRRQARRRARSSYSDLGLGMLPYDYRCSLGYVPMASSPVGIGYHPYMTPSVAHFLQHSLGAFSPHHTYGPYGQPGAIPSSPVAPSMVPSSLMHGAAISATLPPPPPSSPTLGSAPPTTTSPGTTSSSSSPTSASVPTSAVSGMNSLHPTYISSPPSVPLAIRPGSGPNTPTTSLPYGAYFSPMARLW